MTVTVRSGAESLSFEDWALKKVERPKNATLQDFTATFTSKSAEDYKFQEGDRVTITVTVPEAAGETLSFTFDTVAAKKAMVFDGISFERNTAG